LQSINHGNVLANGLGHAGRQVVAKLVVNVQLAWGTGSQEGVVDAVSLGHDLLDSVKRAGIARVLLGGADSLAALPDELINVEIEGQVLLAVGLTQVLAEKQAESGVVENLVETLSVGVAGDARTLRSMGTFALRGAATRQ
jgi:hypothetical protein